MSSDKITYLLNWCVLSSFPLSPFPIAQPPSLSLFLSPTLPFFFSPTWTVLPVFLADLLLFCPFSCRHATPYHIPVFLAQSKGYFADEGIKVAILEPNDPSDVTELIGSGKVDMGAKAMGTSPSLYFASGKQADHFRRLAQFTRSFASFFLLSLLSLQWTTAY
jgi:hypothetical protein